MVRHWNGQLGNDRVSVTRSAHDERDQDRTTVERDRHQDFLAGAPVFNDAIGAVDCVLEKTINHFATTVAIGRVVDVVARGSGDPLIYFRGGFLND